MQFMFILGGTLTVHNPLFFCSQIVTELINANLFLGHFHQNNPSNAVHREHIRTHNKGGVCRAT